MRLKGSCEESYSVDIAYDGKEGLGSALVTDYDLVILDRILPGISDGLEICKQMRKEGKNTPVLILTARDKIEDRVNGLNVGADDYLIKPFAFEELLARIKALLRRPSKNTGTILGVADLTLNTITYEVKRAHKKIELSRTEFQLLEYLMRNPDRILTKDNLIGHVWDYDADIMPNTVEVYIGYLRDKIDKSFSHKLIHTVRGFGYKIGVN